MIMNGRKDIVRVAHVLGNLGHGGAEMGVIRLIENFGSADFDHCIVVLGSDLGLKETTATQVPCYSLRRWGRDYAAFLALRTFFLGHNVDLVHVNNLGPWWDAALAAKLAGCHCIETFHGVEEGQLKFSLPKKILFQAAAHLSRGMTAVAQPAARLAAQLTGIAGERIRVIPNGIDGRKFRPVAGAGEKRRLRCSLGLPGSAVLLGCVGALRPVKNHAGLIAAFARACADGSVDVRLVLVGGGPLDAELRDLCRTLGVANRVIFLGLRDDVPKILQALDGFVLNSDTEGLSYAVLEAMACSLPIIATEVGANPELIENGVHGWLYAVGNEVRLAELLAQAAREPDVLKACGARAREKAVGDYGLDRMAHAYAQFYHEVLSHSTASGAVMEGR